MGLTHKDQPMSKTYYSARGNPCRLFYDAATEPALTVDQTGGPIVGLYLSPADARDLARRILEDYPEPRYVAKPYLGDKWWVVEDTETGDLVADFNTGRLTEPVAKAQAERTAKELNNED